MYVGRQSLQFRPRDTLIGGNNGKSLCCSFQEQPVHFGFILIRNLAERVRNRENQMKVRDRQKLGFAFRKPFSGARPLTFRAVPVAT